MWSSVFQVQLIGTIHLYSSQKECELDQYQHMLQAEVMLLASHHQIKAESTSTKKKHVTSLQGFHSKPLIGCCFFYLFIYLIIFTLKLKLDKSTVFRGLKTCLVQTEGHMTTLTAPNMTTMMMKYEHSHSQSLVLLWFSYLFLTCSQ